MNKPLVSIIVPCYNQAIYLSEAIQSVLEQTYANWECLIINDGSPDNTEEVALDLLRLDPRIQYYKKENGGISDARNYGIARANGVYILPLDGDDKIGERYIELAVNEIEKDSSVKVVYCEAEFFGAKEGKWEIIEYTPEMMARHNLIFCSALFKKDDFNLTEGYNTNMKHGLEDWNFWISMLKTGGKVVRIPEVLFKYRIKENSRNASVNYTKMQMMYMQAYLNHPDFFDRYFSTPIEVLHDYVNLRNYCKELQQDNAYLKGIIKFRFSSYKSLFLKLFKY